MSKKKLLIREVFEQAERESGKTSKNGLSLYLKVHLETFNIYLDEKTFVRYYDAFVLEKGKEMEPDVDTLNKLSKYIGYTDFADFSRTFIKKDEDANKTTVKISVDKDEESITDRLSNIIINITNEQNFKMPEFIKKNGLGLMEMVLLVCLVTGNVVFSHPKKEKSYGFAGSLPILKCMYWDGSEYKLVDCNNKNPLYDDKIPVDEVKLKFFKRVLRKDTLTIENALGKTWYSKYNGDVQFFTKDGEDPDNGRELKKATAFMINKYAGLQPDSIEVE